MPLSMTHRPAQVRCVAITEADSSSHSAGRLSPHSIIVSVAMAIPKARPCCCLGDAIARSDVVHGSAGDGAAAFNCVGIELIAAASLRVRGRRCFRVSWQAAGRSRPGLATVR